MVPVPVAVHAESARSARRDETFGRRARCRQAQCHVPAISEKFLLESLNTRSPPPARIAVRRRSSSGRLRAPPGSAPRPGRRTNCCPVRFARPRPASGSSTKSKRLCRALRASACPVLIVRMSVDLHQATGCLQAPQHQFQACRASLLRQRLVIVLYVMTGRGRLDRLRYGRKRSRGGDRRHSMKVANQFALVQPGTSSTLKT